MNRHGDWSPSGRRRGRLADRLEAQGAKGVEEAAPLRQGLRRPGEVAELDVRGAEGVSAKAKRVSYRGRDATGRSSLIAGGVVRRGSARGALPTLMPMLTSDEHAPAHANAHAHIRKLGRKGGEYPR